MKKISTSIYLALLLVLVFVGCSKQETTELQPSPEIDNQELILGIFFGMGEVSNLVPEIQEVKDLKVAVSKSEVSQEKVDFINEFVATFVVEHEAMVNEFRQSISGNSPYAVDAQMKEISQKLALDFIDLVQSKEEYLYKETASPISVDQKQEIIAYRRAKLEDLKAQLNDPNSPELSSNLLCVVGPVVLAVAVEAVAVVTDVWFWWDDGPVRFRDTFSTEEQQNYGNSNDHEMIGSPTLKTQREMFIHSLRTNLGDKL